MSGSGASSLPRASVVIATYNWATVLPYSIGSVLDQTFTDFELLVVGDGCTDESAEVVASFADPRVRWINLGRNTGHQSGPNNEGGRQAQGSVVAYLGHDDLWLPQHLGLLVGAVEAGAPGVHTSVLEVCPGTPPFVTPAAEWVFAPGAWIFPTSFAIDRAVLERVGGWRAPRTTGMLTPEADLIARMFDVAGPPVWIPRVTCVKFPASKRHNVYQARPNFEQEHWLERIRAAADPEAAMLAAVDVADGLAGEAHEMRSPLATRVWRSVRYRSRKRLGLEPGIRASTQIREHRRFKGL